MYDMIDIRRTDMKTMKSDWFIFFFSDKFRFSLFFFFGII